MNRVDVLAPDDRRFDVITGDVLGDIPDDELQAITTEARAVTGAPTAGISLVLQTIQYFRAADGLPTDLGHVRAVARDTAFCQYVVRDDAPFEVLDIPARVELPQDLVQRYGFRSYQGHPVRLDDTVLGALCVFDTQPRAFDDGVRGRLAGLAARAEARLAVLAERGQELAQPIRAALQPAISALHTRLKPLRPAVIEARVAALELEVVTNALMRRDISPAVVENLAPALSAIGLLQDRLGALETATDQALRGVELLREIATPASLSVRLIELIEGADAIARPLTDAVGGVRWRLPVSDCAVALGRPLAVAILSTTLSTLAGLIRKRTVDAQLSVEVTRIGSELIVEATSPRMRYSDGQMVVEALGRLGVDASPARVLLTGSAVQCALPVVAASSALD